MTKTVFFKIIKNIFAVIFSFILSIALFISCLIAYWRVTDSWMTLVEVHYEKNIPPHLKVQPAEELVNPEYCIKTIKVKDNKNNERYLYCGEEDLINYGKDSKPISQNKVFYEYYLDENKNITEIIGDSGVYYISTRYVYNDNGKLILLIYFSTSGPTNLHIYILK